MLLTKLIRNLLDDGGEKNKMEYYNNELYHYGVKGMKWGVRRSKKELGYKSTGIRSTLARRSNDKVDKSFNEWRENAKKRDDAITLGKKANTFKLAYEKDKSNKTLANDYKQANKDYKKALRQNTTYRKGVVKQEVGRDASRKYLSEAKKVKKQLSNDPSNKDLQKQYNDLMSKHDVERAKARRAVDISAKRMRAQANIKRTMTMTAKAAAGTAAVAAGTYVVNSYLSNHRVTLNGQTVRFSTQKVSSVIDIAKKTKDFMGYFV